MSPISSRPDISQELRLLLAKNPLWLGGSSQGSLFLNPNPGFFFQSLYFNYEILGWVNNNTLLTCDTLNVRPHCDDVVFNRGGEDFCWTWTGPGSDEQEENEAIHSEMTAGSIEMNVTVSEKVKFDGDFMIGCADGGKTWLENQPLPVKISWSNRFE